MRPTVMVIDLDRFKQVNDSVGIAVPIQFCSRLPAASAGCSSRMTRWLAYR